MCNNSCNGGLFSNECIWWIIIILAILYFCSNSGCGGCGTPTPFSGCGCARRDDDDCGCGCGCR